MGLYDVTRDELADLLADQASYRVTQIWDGLYRHGTAPGDLTVLPLQLRARLAGNGALAPSLQADAQLEADRGATVKWRWALSDGRRIETVLMRMSSERPAAPDRANPRATVCVSSQAGCAMACGFCATGQAGFDRNLTTGEIVEQVVRARTEATRRGWRLTNVVFLGMGEPLANYDRVWPAVRRLHDDVGLSARHLTISTIGIVPGIRRLAHEDLPVSLAVSLHAANDELRSRLVPVNRRYPLAALTEACRVWQIAKGRRLSLEWALIHGVNDRRSDVVELAELARSLAAHVNLIPLNPTPGFATRGTPPEGVRAFRDRLADRGVNVTVRHNRGTDIAAACGQLAAAVAGPEPAAAAEAR
ncbi:MAG TPA: 23S rRNA (adenine(2503)-C(2))-methyltransferase RlmN [Acidimicrobiales bacterium]|nr:23S rRNA (adenine(2503)-C(2))-methyltransferase RlmN [Acidimicrobiales bacterium]